MIFRTTSPLGREAVNPLKTDPSAFAWIAVVRIRALDADPALADLALVHCGFFFAEVAGMFHLGSIPSQP